LFPYALGVARAPALRPRRIARSAGSARGHRSASWPAPVSSSPSSPRNDLRIAAGIEVPGGCSSAGDESLPPWPAHHSRHRWPSRTPRAVV